MQRGRRWLGAGVRRLAVTAMRADCNRAKEEAYQARLEQALAQSAALRREAVEHVIRHSEAMLHTLCKGDVDEP